MRFRGIWAASLLATLLVVTLSVVACSSAASVASLRGTPAATPSSSETETLAGRTTVAWTAFNGDSAIEVWIAVSNARLRVLATLTQDPNTCAAYVATGLPMLSPDGATMLPQVRSYGWVDNRTVFAFSQYNFTSVDRTYPYTLGAGQPTALAGLGTPLEGVVRGSTLYYLDVVSGEGGIQSIVRRYDLSHRELLPGGIDLGAYAACSECPDM